MTKKKNAWGNGHTSRYAFSFPCDRHWKAENEADRKIVGPHSKLKAHVRIALRASTAKVTKIGTLTYHISNNFNLWNLHSN